MRGIVLRPGIFGENRQTLHPSTARNVNEI